MGVNTEYLRIMIILFWSMFALYAAGLIWAQKPERWATSKY